MTIVGRIKNLFRNEPDEQVLGYTPAELRLLFKHATDAGYASVAGAYPQKFSLAAAGTHAVYAAFLIDKSDLASFMVLVDKHFVTETRRQCHGAGVVQGKGIGRDERLCFLVTEEFHGHAVRCVTDSLSFLSDIDQARFAPPPPWVAFRDYNPQWWGGAMQGAQGYYDQHYFSPFFQNLDAGTRVMYCERFGASSAWRTALALFYDADEDLPAPR